MQLELLVTPVPKSKGLSKVKFKEVGTKGCKKIKTFFFFFFGLNFSLISIPGLAADIRWATQETLSNIDDISSMLGKLCSWTTGFLPPTSKSPRCLKAFGIFSVFFKTICELPLLASLYRVGLFQYRVNAVTL